MSGRAIQQARASKPCQRRRRVVSPRCYPETHARAAIRARVEKMVIPLAVKSRAVSNTFENCQREQERYAWPEIGPKSSQPLTSEDYQSTASSESIALVSTTPNPPREESVGARGRSNITRSRITHGARALSLPPSRTWAKPPPLSRTWVGQTDDPAIPDGSQIAGPPERVHHLAKLLAIVPFRQRIARRVGVRVGSNTWSHGPATRRS